MNTSRHVFSKKTPQTVLKMLLMAGISYAAVPVCHVQAQETAKHSGVVHKHVTKKKKAVVTAPVTIAPAAHTTTTISATPPLSKVTAVNSAVIQSSSPEQVTVTGTRLSQTRLTNVMAGTSIDATQLAARGYTNLGLALLRENPAFSVPSNSQIGSQGSFGAGQTFSGLFGLGDQRTLTLIDGMRMVGGATSSMFGSSSGSQVDVGTIPTSLVKKIDRSMVAQVLHTAQTLSAASSTTSLMTTSPAWISTLRAISPKSLMRHRKRSSSKLARALIMARVGSYSTSNTATAAAWSPTIA